MLNEKQKEPRKTCFYKGFYSKGVGFLLKEDYENALFYFEKAAKENPYYAEAYFAIGYCKHYLHHPGEAIKAYKQAIYMNPDYVKAHYGLGMAYGNLGRPRKAIEAFKRAIYINPDYAKAHYGLGMAYLLILKDRKMALEEYKILKGLDKELANKLFNLIYK